MRQFRSSRCFCQGRENGKPYLNDMLSSPDNCATHWICFIDFENSFGIHNFRFTWPCLIVEVLATWAKLLAPPGCYTVINCAFTFSTANIFGCFHSIIDHFELVKQKLLNQTKLHVHLCSFQTKHWVKQWTTCQRTKLLW